MSTNQLHKPKILAHRGASAYAPENTMDAFLLGAAQGADGFELDVHLCADGQVCVAHDLLLERVSDGTGRICDYSLDDLRKLDFSRPIPGHAPCTISTLGEVYARFADTQLHINVELKTTEELYPAMPEKLLALEREYSMQGRVLYSSFNHYSLLAIKALDKNAQIGLLYDLGLVDPWVYARHISADAIHPHYRIIMALPQTVAQCREAGIAVNAWTADDPRAIAFLAGCGVDAIITNKPDAAIAAITQ